ncbi:MAG: hypothetical protein JWR74_2747 [Polaromonas sp.]|nr:hypothetical protein [Polaromonas sp.]
MNAHLAGSAEAILESLADGFLAMSYDWRLIYVNPAAQALIARSPENLLGQVVWDVFPVSAQSLFGMAYRRVAHQKVAETLSGFYSAHQRWYELRVYPASYGISVYFRDISAHQRQEAERVRLVDQADLQRRVYETALSNSADFNYVFDLEGRFVYANQRLLALWEIELPAALGKNFLDLHYPTALAERLQGQIREVIETGRTIRDETPYTSACGERQYAYVFVPVLGVQGRVVAVSGSTRDVTERKLAEEILQQSDRRNDEFLAILAHELRNPLASLSNWLEILNRPGSSQAMVEKAPEVMGRQVAQLVSLVDDLMDLSRINRGVVDIKKERVLLHALVVKAVETVQHLSDQAAHRLEVRWPSDNLPMLVDADPARIIQVLTNLLNNAIKFTAPGGVIFLSAEREGNHVAMRVTDTGIGIDADMRPRVFDMFTHADVTIGRAVGGLGIGLSLVKGLVDLHGGSVEVQSEGRGRGSQFTVRLPIVA